MISTPLHGTYNIDIILSWFSEREYYLEIFTSSIIKQKNDDETVYIPMYVIGTTGKYPQDNCLFPHYEVKESNLYYGLEKLQKLLTEKDIE